MATPTVTLAFDQPTYNPGDTITATGTIAGFGDTFTGTLVITNSADSSQSVTATGTFSVNPALTESMSDSGSHVWTEVAGATGSQVQYTSTA